MTPKPDVLQLLALFEEQRAQYVKALRECESATPPRRIPLAITRGLFETAAAVMVAYCHPSNWPKGHDKPPKNAFPPVLAYIVADFTRYFAAGKAPGPVLDVLRQGAPATGPEELRAQGWAVAYSLAVKAGVIVDSRPTRTVAEAFAIEPRTLQRWIRQQQQRGLSWRDVVPAMPANEVGKYLTRKMREAGAQYMKKGRLATPRGRGDI